MRRRRLGSILLAAVLVVWAACAGDPRPVGWATPGEQGAVPHAAAAPGPVAADPVESVLIVRVFDLGPGGLGGGGEAILLTDSSSAGVRHALVDAGPRGEADGTLRRGYVAGRLVALGVDTLEYVQLSHAHADHLLGLADVAARVHVRRFVYNGQPRSWGDYERNRDAAAGAADTVIVPRGSAHVFVLGAHPEATVLATLPPLDAYVELDTNDSRMLNEGSLGTAVRLGGFRAFLTGDGQWEAHARWRVEFADATRGLDLLKVGHHGANNAIFDAGSRGPASWLAHSSPDLAVISSNGRTHPRRNALAALTAAGTRTLCTSTHGDIELRIRPAGDVAVTVQRNAAEPCAPGTEADT